MVLFPFRGFRETHLTFLLPSFHPFFTTRFTQTMDEVLSAWENLSLTAEESTKLSLTKSKNLKEKEYVLAAKFLTKRALNVEAIGRTFKPLWRARDEFKIREAGDHILLFVFKLETDAERVLAQEPWSFDKHLVLFQRYDYSTQPNTYALQRLFFGCKYMVCL